MEISTNSNNKKGLFSYSWVAFMHDSSIPIRWDDKELSNQILICWNRIPGDNEIKHKMKWLLERKRLENNKQQLQQQQQKFDVPLD